VIREDKPENEISNESKESLKNHDGNPKKVSFFGLFRYSTKLEKIMIFIGLLGAICQGATLPLM